VELIVPVTGGNAPANLQDQVGYQFTITPPANGAVGVVTWRVMALENNANMFVNVYAQNGAPGFGGVFPRFTALSAANFPPNTWVDIELDLSEYAFLAGADAGVLPEVDAGVVAADAGDAGVAPNSLDPGTFDKTAVAALGIQLGTTEAFTGSGVARLAIDSVTISGIPGQVTKEFTTSADGLAINMFEVPTGTQDPIFH
jgi:hypothetical protein